MDNFIPQDEIDAGAEALRNHQQSGKRLTPWSDLSNSVKRKWRNHAAIVLTAAAPASAVKRAG